jgi:hypothetical protein
MGPRSVTGERILGSLIAIGLTACAGSPDVKPPPALPALELGESKELGRPLWTKQLPGLITEVLMAPNGDVLLSTRPESGRGHHAVFRYSAQGKLRWRASFRNLVRALALSDDGNHVFYNAYQDELGSLGPGGKPAWKRTALCRPYGLPQGNLLCFQDDDDRPGLVFQVWNAQGEPLWKKEAPLDAVTLALSEDRNRIALGYAGGKVEVLESSQGQVLFEQKVSGEVVDLSLSSDGKQLGILYTDLRKRKKLALFDHGNGPNGDLALDFPAEQISFASGSTRLIAADPGGSSPRFAIFETKPDLKLLWERESRQPAEYSIAARNLGADWGIYLGVGSSEGKLVRAAEVAALTAEPVGHLRWRARVAVPAGGYLYAFDGAASREDHSGWLAIATDLGTLSTYKIKK